MTIRQITVGIDPGASGGIAIMWEDGMASAYPWTSPEDALETFREIAPTHEDDHPVTAWIEQVGGHIGTPQPGSAMFKFGLNTGWYHGVLMALGIPFRQVRPQQWQKGIPGLRKAKGAARKRLLKTHATQIFPGIKPTLKTCDALLIADYGRSNS